jgi:hypothetical protein
MKTIAVILVSEDFGAHANHNGERRLPACSVRQPAEHIFSGVREIRREEIAAGQAARQNRLAACAPQPFWTWFIDNPRPQSSK